MIDLNFSVGVVIILLWAVKGFYDHRVNPKRYPWYTPACFGWVVTSAFFVCACIEGNMATTSLNEWDKHGYSYF